MYKSKKFNVGQRVVVTGNHRFYGGRYKGRYGLLTEYIAWGDWKVRLDSGRVEIFHSRTLALNVEEDDDLYI